MRHIRDIYLEQLHNSGGRCTLPLYPAAVYIGLEEVLLPAY
jgi:hypothetical protein